MTNENEDWYRKKKLKIITTSNIKTANNIISHQKILISSTNMKDKLRIHRENNHPIA